MGPRGCPEKQRRMVVSYRCFGTTYRSHIKGTNRLGLMKMGPIGCPEKQRRMVVSYRRFETTYRSHIKGSNGLGLMKMGPIGSPGTSVINNHSTLRKITKESRYESWVKFGVRGLHAY